MSLLDTVLIAVTGAGPRGGPDGLADTLSSLLANNGEHGGLVGLMDKFNQAGQGEVIGSWIGKGKNLPISADQLQDVLGRDAMSNIANQLSIDPAQASGQLSHMLPSLIDKLTPHGTAPAGGLGNTGDLLGMLGGLPHKR
ncbi:YidB family protein (plasmid) [Polaromonas sp. P1-6]|nr:YidB family protein [Polaromonas sp. P1-6]